MKKVICFMLCLLLLLSFTACGGDTAQPRQPEDAVFTENNVTVLKDAFPESAKITVEVLSDTTEVEKALPAARSLEVYDINAFLDNNHIQPSGTVEVTFPLPTAYNAAEHNIEVYYIADDGTTEKLEAAVQDNAVVAKLTHFSVYAVAVVEKLSFNIAVGAEKAILKDGNKFFISDNNEKHEYNTGDTWLDFADRMKDKGFSVGKDFYGKEDLVYYTVNGVKYQVVQAVNAGKVSPSDAISKDIEYACMLPHRETIQCQWFYDISTDAPASFDKVGKELILDTANKTYTIKQISFKKLGLNTHTADEKILESGTYTSTDGDTLGATLTLSNGYVLKTSRDDSFVATLIANGKTITVKTDNKVNFYEITF